MLGTVLQLWSLGLWSKYKPLPGSPVGSSEEGVGVQEPHGVLWAEQGQAGWLADKISQFK